MPCTTRPGEKRQTPLSLRGQAAVATGADSGVGRFATETLLRAGSQVPNQPACLIGGREDDAGIFPSARARERRA